MSMCMVFRMTTFMFTEVSYTKKKKTNKYTELTFFSCSVFLHLPMLPKIIPFSVEETFTFALMLQKSCGANITGCGRSTSFKSPNVANSSVQFCKVSPAVKLK